MDRSKLISLGLKFRKARLLRGLTQERLAHRIDRDHPAITRLEKGRTNPTYLFLTDICEALEMDLSAVLEMKLVDNEEK